MTIFSSTSGRGESTGYGVYSTLLRPVSRRGDTPKIPWLARWVGSSAQGGNECNRTAMLVGSPTALSASRRKNSLNEVLGGGTEVCISVDRVAEGARTVEHLACTARGSDLPCLVLRASRSERPLRLIAKPPHDLGGLTDVCLAQFVAHRRSNHQKPRVQLAV